MICNPETRAGAVLDIDLGAIVANWRGLADRVAPARTAAVVKADAYGLGAADVAPALLAAGCKLFFVATLDEAIALRPLLPGAEIAVLSGLLPGWEGDLVAHRLSPVLNDPGQIQLWTRVAAEHGGLPAMLHVDTGMSRLGLTPGDLDRVREHLTPGGPIRWTGLLSHLACADEPDHALNPKQLREFTALRRALTFMPASLSASSGIFLGRGYHCEFVRPGIALYGGNPLPGTPNPMRPVVRLRARILQLRHAAEGESVGYGATHVLRRASRLATVGLGYADGWPRSMTGQGSGRIAGKRVALLGRVSMDLLIFDVTEIDPDLARPGAFIELLGPDYDVDAAAADAGTISYEILTRLGRRYHRNYRGGPETTGASG